MKRQQDWNDVFLLLSLIRDYEKETGPTVVWLLKIRILLYVGSHRKYVCSTLTESRNKMRGDKVCMPNLTAFYTIKERKWFASFTMHCRLCYAFMFINCTATELFLKKFKAKIFYTHYHIYHLTNTAAVFKIIFLFF